VAEPDALPAAPPEDMPGASVADSPEDFWCIDPHAASEAVHATRAIHLEIDIKFSLKINDAAWHWFMTRAEKFLTAIK
jgi:hypothetical protein